MIEKRDNITYINEEGQYHIKLLLGVKPGKEEVIADAKRIVEEYGRQFFPSEMDLLKQENERLKQEVENLQYQLQYERSNAEDRKRMEEELRKEKDKAFNLFMEDHRKLMQLFDQEQRLHSQTQLQLKAPAKESTESNNVVIETPQKPKQKKGLFRNPFKKNKE